MRSCILASTVALLCSSVQASSFYGVGNSLLADSYTNVISMPLFAASRGHTVSAGYHIVGGTSLEGIWGQSVNDSWNTYAVSPSRFDSALPNNQWDQVALEPFAGSAASEEAAALKFIDLARSNPANQQTRFLVFASWPGLDANGQDQFPTVWNAPYTGGVNGNARSAAYFGTILSDLRAARADVNIDMIPVGHVFELLDERAEAGQIPGLTSITQAYRDELHSGRVGMYASALTWYATLFKEDPRGLPMHPNFLEPLPTQSLVPDPVMAGAIQQAVYDVVFGNPQLTGVPEPTSVAVLAGATVVVLRRRPR